jgi:DMSO/TMAO reductase YedYZ heme-binding membrane subunit
VIRATARTSLLFFAPAFAATGLRKLWRAPASAWLLRNRRYVGLSFAFSHAIHLAAILAMAATVPGFAEGVSTTTALGGGTAYVFIAAMALTSSDAALRRLGRRSWRALHVTGMWVIFAIFVSSYGGRASHNPNYWPHAALLAAAPIIRLLAVARSCRLRSMDFTFGSGEAYRETARSGSGEHPRLVKAVTRASRR